jgi:signal transduction histidine kinase
MPAQMLMTGETMTDDMRRRLGELMFRNATRLHGFFDRLLQLSALRSDQWKAKLTQTTLARVVETALEELAESAAKKGVLMDTELVADTPITVACKEMTAAIASVFDNAIRYSQSGSRVKVRLETDGTTHVLSVTDHGKGIDASILPLVFEELADCEDLENNDVMIDGEIEDGLGRYGLSLAIARHLLSKHGGEISVESEPGSWTTFRICLPACSEELEEELVAVDGKGQEGA